MDFFDIFDEINLQKIDNVQITPDEEKNVYNLYQNLKKTLKKPKSIN